MEIGNNSNVTGSQSTSLTKSMNIQDLGKVEFLKLLVSQLSHQDPLNPQDGTQFVAQLAQFTSLEQLMNVSKGMESMAMAQTASVNSQVVNFIGKEVITNDNSLQLGEEGKVGINFKTGETAKSIQVQIRDANGKVVRNIDMGATGAGEQNIIWDGRDDDGKTLPPGEYNYNVNAQNTAGQEMGVTNQARRRITGVVFENGSPYLMAGNSKIALSDVTSVFEGK